jgi:hypothetical protein
MVALTWALKILDGPVRIYLMIDEYPWVINLLLRIHRHHRWILLNEFNIHAHNRFGMDSERIMGR